MKTATADMDNSNFFKKKLKKYFADIKKRLYICNVKIDKTDCTDLQNIKI